MGKKENNTKWRERNRKLLNLRAKHRRYLLKLETLERYGTECAHCGFSDIRALQIDHIDNDGSEERRLLGGQNFSGYRFYKHLKKMGWPEGYQTLCANCNLIKYIGELPDFDMLLQGGTCLDCGDEISQTSRRCRSCGQIHRFQTEGKIKDEELISRVLASGLGVTAAELGVTTQALGRRFKRATGSTLSEYRQAMAP